MFLCVAIAGCGGTPAKVSDHDAREIFTALRRVPLIYAPDGCFNVRRPVGVERQRAYALAIAVARKDPGAELKSPDFSDDHPAMREWLARSSGMIGECLDKEPRAGAGWRALKRELDRAVRGLS